MFVAHVLQTMPVYHCKLVGLMNQWRVPWELIERMDEIRKMMVHIQVDLQHIFREGNFMADSLANEVVKNKHTKNITDL